MSSIYTIKDDILLLNHFPPAVAQAMMHSFTVTPTCKLDASIFFSSIIYYVLLRGSNDPATLSCMLELLFNKFDELAAIRRWMPSTAATLPGPLQDRQTSLIEISIEAGILRRGKGAIHASAVLSALVIFRPLI
jgi:hypothetical protein